ncbi:tyrosine-type recombinase/integrase [Streptomyces sp. NPDC102437]|uniref:tyrosine-type recombinase/integrase n=1 Tax=Streptomyces sp. NPDC102437 TaxID=3366175 RepID=UPI0038001456
MDFDLVRKGGVRPAADRHGSTRPRQGLVFTTKNGTPIEPRNPNRSFEALCARAAVRKVCFHDLRHTCASLLHEQALTPE